MRFKYFTLLLIFTIIFSLATVVASEDVNQNVISDDTLSIGDAEDENLISSLDNEIKLSSSEDMELETQNADKNLLKDNEDSSSDNVDLSVDMELGDVQKETFGINEMTFEVPFIITTMVTDGVAKNVKVYINIPDDFEYQSCDSSIGNYNPETGIWEIGDLDSNVDATLTIITKISKRGTYIISVNSTTDSNDTDLYNNDLQCTIEVTSKVTSSTTRTSTQRAGADHNNHQISETTPIVDPRVDETPVEEPPVEPEPEPEPSPGVDDPYEEQPTQEDPNNGGGQGTGQGQGGNNGQGTGMGVDSPSPEESGSHVGFLTKSTQSLVSTISETFSSLGDIFNPTSLFKDSSSKANMSKEVVKAIAAQDYAKVPILIFVVFLIALFGVGVYDKVKS